MGKRRILSAAIVVMTLYASGGCVIATTDNAAVACVGIANIALAGYITGFVAGALIGKKE